MASVVGAHGISQQESGPERQLRVWRDSFLLGMKRARCPKDEIPTLAVAFYGHLFRKGSPYDLGEADEQEWDDDEIAFVARALDELTAGKSADELDDLLRASQTLGPPALIPPRLLRGAAAVDQRWGMGRGLLLIGDLRQVHTYLHIPAAGEEIRSIVTEAVNEDTGVLIGHSLGSVIVYDLLSRGALPQIRSLVTLGSPLRLHTVWSELPAADSSLPDVLWLNVYDPWDPVTVGQGLEPHAEDIKVTNSRNDPHAVKQYLAREETALAILRCTQL